MAAIIKSLKVLADPTRLRLLLLLGQEELSVVEIQEILGMGQSRISSHLAQLKAAGLVSDRQAGKHRYYRTPELRHGPWWAIIESSAQEIAEAEADQVALRFVLRRRLDKARDYFNRLAGGFGRSNCPGRSWGAMARMLLCLVGPITVADLGAGEGTLSQLLARHAKRVIAIDNSEKMVEYGSQLARENGFENVEYRLGDMEEPPIEPGTVDLVLMSQALHHAANPSRAIAAARTILKPGGRVAILDLLAHQVEAARELYADLWLGFGEVQLHEMLRAAGFTAIDVEVVDRETDAPHFQTLLATALKPTG
ncbi:MAG TPA: metalloregulator ArsR/SmtB family transcription factor [Chthoniobacteraceae bacterium]|nr:metalloregulator ArsR/SmtB family transcription factor [Chthoniobacteraceae bacterium]